MPEIIDPVFVKTSQNARFLVSENERFGLVFVKTGSINSGTAVSAISTFSYLQSTYITRQLFVFFLLVRKLYEPKNSSEAKATIEPQEEHAFSVKISF